MSSLRPLTSFNFKVNLELPGNAAPICGAEFSECDGLEMNVQPKTIREGGNNGRQIHLAGPVSYGRLTLRRGMTDSFGLWNWFEKAQRQRRLRAAGEIIMLDANHVERVRFAVSGCLPVKLKAPGLNGMDGLIAVEEMQVAYEMLKATLVDRQ